MRRRTSIPREYDTGGKRILKRRIQILDDLRERRKFWEQKEEAFATVFKARDSLNDTIVAVKKIKLGSRAEAKDGINRTALREIKLLQELKHPNIINLMDVFGHKSNVSLVFDFMDTDLEVIIKDTSIVLTPANVKAYMLMTLQGLDSNGVLKLGDFGLAKFFGSPNRIYTHQVVTRWYRCPELLFGARMYGTGVDMWALGCILAELLLRVPFLSGESDLDQLTRIFQVLGTPTEESWTVRYSLYSLTPHALGATSPPFLKVSLGVTTLPDFIQFKQFPGTPLRHIFTAASDDLLELLGSLLAIVPLHRCSCQQALKMPYFRWGPYHRN
uniref:Cyclin-dependent kinase 7 n=1 Tax=Timema californicum TaxID=61474 RepID=A0A7R9P9M1_TIMCA|nr:unnamed protein product [Timema californicum]